MVDEAPPPGDPHPHTPLSPDLRTEDSLVTKDHIEHTERFLQKFGSNQSTLGILFEVSSRTDPGKQPEVFDFVQAVVESRPTDTKTVATDELRELLDVGRHLHGMYQEVVLRIPREILDKLKRLAVVTQPSRPSQPPQK